MNSTTPRMYPVPSNSVDAIGYDPWTQELHVRSRGNETVYVYFDVKLEIYESLLAADSIDAFINQQIKPRYLTSKLSDVA